MKRWKCHKRVWAEKIKEVYIPNPNQAPDDGGRGLLLEDGGVVILDRAYMEKHKPQAGGYFVVYEDGYQSFSPAAAFESGYTVDKGLTFGDAIEALKRGKRVVDNQEWNQFPME